ncbi:hypothetical protein [Pseudomonas fluorescens]|nr:hypothetical protein [Pseudomonas fluorescens]
MPGTTFRGALRSNVGASLLAKRPAQSLPPNTSHHNSATALPPSTKS